jgi:hypothetical protein
LLGTPHLSDPPTYKSGEPAPKYSSAQGSTRIYPYPHSALRVPGAPLLVVEGEFDALLATQILGDRFNVVTWTAASTDPAKAHVPAEYWAGTRWYLLFDADAAGQAAAHRWQEVHPTAKLLTYPPGVNDFGELCASGGVTRWLEQLQLQS